jgi:hypothetical protein
MGHFWIIARSFVLLHQQYPAECITQDVRIQCSEMEKRMQKKLGNAARRIQQQFSEAEQPSGMYFHLWTIMQKMEFLASHWWLVLLSKYTALDACSATARQLFRDHRTRVPQRRTTVPSFVKAKLTAFDRFA